MEKPNCYKCIYRKEVPGDTHSRCANVEAKVEGNEAGIRRGWFNYPYNFDPTWLVSCNGFKSKEQKL